MLFPTPEFALFFFLVFLASWALIQYPRLRKGFLILASYFFYGFWDWRFTLLLLGASVTAWLLARLIARSSGRRPRIFWLTAAVTLDLGILFFYKYYGFFLSSLNNLFLTLRIPREIPILSVILPVGISFFIFQALSYVIDVYRGDVEARENLGDVLLYISFFPQLVAGPIVRASVFLPQLDTNPAEDQIPAGNALFRIFSGLVKKVFLANYLAVQLADPVFLSPGGYAWWEVLLGLYGYAFQIFCDFSAYSDIAIGVATLLGYRFPENFRQPYRALGLRDFWKRWHISLSSWLRDYLYIPLGGSRKGPVRTAVNLFITMFLGGLWHGAAWNFVIWGLLHGAGQAAERSMGFLKKMNSLPGRLLGRIVTFHFVCLCWIFFRSPDLPSAGRFFRALFSSGGAPAGLLNPFTALLLLFGLALHWVPEGWRDAAGRGLGRIPLVFQGLLLGGGFLILQILSPQGVAPFIYFQF